MAQPDILVVFTKALDSSTQLLASTWIVFFQDAAGQKLNG